MCAASSALVNGIHKLPEDVWLEDIREGGVEGNQCHMSRLDDKVCLVHEVMERQLERDRGEMQANFTELFTRLRAVEKQIWLFAGVIAALVFLGDFIPKILKAIGRMP
jgi:hypothetical protein